MNSTDDDIGGRTEGAERDEVSRMMTLFEGFADAYGMYRSSAANSAVRGGKLEIKDTAKTVREPVTRFLWSNHLAGRQPLGIMPLRDNNTCLWGVIDIDEYDVSHAEVVASVEKNKFPLVACRSKSGGIHLFLFLAEPAPAELLQARLREMAVVLGYGQSEVFPKQKEVKFERGDLPSWLNMPYFGGDDTERYGIKSGGLAMTLREFLDYAESMQQSPRLLDRSFRAESRSTRTDGRGRQERDPTFGDGPPCMQHLTTVGFPEGSRNKGLFALATFAKRKFGSKWQDVVEDWNRQFFDPPLPSSEVMQIIRSHDRKDYNYTCKEHPLSAHCNSTLCATRRFGVGGEDDYPAISGLSVIKTSPPLWFLDVSGKRMELTTDQLQNYQLFHKSCMEQLFVCFKMMKNGDWLTTVSEAMKTAVEIDVPQEVGHHGQFMELLEDFVLNRHRGQSPEDLLLGRPFEDEDRKRHYFRLRDLMRFLEMANFKTYNRAQVSDRIKQLGGGKMFFNVKNKGVNAFYIPTIFAPIPPSTLPAVEREPI